LYDPNEDTFLQKLLNTATHEQLKQMYSNLYVDYQKLRLNHEELQSSISWQKSYEHAVRTGGWL